MSEHRYTLREEIANAVTHGIGVLASVAGGAVLITLAAVHGNAWHVVAASVFVTALVLLYVASTLYHAIPHATAKRRLKVFDHCAIFLLIAGTYTPFTLIGLRALASVFVRQIHPNAVSQPARYAGRRVPDDVLAGIWAFFTAYALIALAATGVVASAGYDLVTSFTASLTALGNVGPGLGEVGPYDNFGHLPDYVKLTLSGRWSPGGSRSSPC